MDPKDLLIQDLRQQIDDLKQRIAEEAAAEEVAHRRDQEVRRLRKLFEIEYEFRLALQKEVVELKRIAGLT